MQERRYQARLIRLIKKAYPGALVLKNDPNYIQGIPDILVLYGNRWGALEVKQSLRAKRRPNQDYYIDLMSQMSFAAYICPENEDEVLDALQSAPRINRAPRFPKSK